MKTSVKIVYITMFLLGVCGFAVWDFFVVSNAVSVGIPVWLSILLILLGLIITVYLGIILHECGHLVFGLFGGMKFKSISFPLVKIISVNGRLKFTFEKKVSFLGVCEMYPGEGVKPAKAFAMMAAGGPIGSFLALLFSVIFLALAPYIGYYTAILFGVPSILLYTVFLDNAFPMCVNGARTDGAQMVEILKQTPSAKVLVTVLTAQAGYRAGLSPSEQAWHDLYDVPQLPDTDLNYMFLLNARYLHALDSGDLDKIRDIDMRIRAILPHIPDIYADQLVCDIFYDSLFIVQDNAFVKANLSAVMKRLDKEDDISACRIRGYYYFRAGDINRAFQEISKGRALAEFYSLPGLAKTELRLLDELEFLIGKSELPT